MERRLHERYAIPVALYHEPDGSLQTFTTRNVSLGGAFVLTDRPLPVGETLVLFLDLPQQTALMLNPGATVQVVRHAEGGMGVKFVEPPDEFLAMLRDEFKRRFAEKS